MSDDLSVIARDLKLPENGVAQTVQLLDEGNTISFIARFRKDRTGGLDAEQLQAIKKRLAEMRGLAERRTFILKSIEQQGALTEELAREINRTTNSRRLEDLYLPFKSKKQSLTLTAKQQGLEPLAIEILEGQKPDSELASRALEFVRVDRGLANVDEVMAGVRHILAEKFAERGELRRELRRILWTQGTLSCKLVLANEGGAGRPEPNNARNDSDSAPGTEGQLSGGETPNFPENAGVERVNSNEQVIPSVASAPADTEPEGNDDPTVSVHQMSSADSADQDRSSANEQSSDDGTTSESGETGTEVTPELAAPELSTPELSTPELSTPGLSTPGHEVAAPAEQAEAAATPTRGDSAREAKTGKNAKKKKSTPHPFKDYENFSEPLKNIPHHRILAINRGERAGQLKAKVKIENSLVEPVAFASIAESHPFRDVLRDCARDAVNRLILPSLEREVRRELTENAEQHAIRVFAHNLRCLLLQPPVRGKQILSIDPGYKNGCAVAVLDAQGSIVHVDRIFVVGNAARQAENRTKLAQLIRNHQIQVVAIGNGTACREVEQMVSDAIQQDLNEPAVTVVAATQAESPVSVASDGSVGGTEAAAPSSEISSSGETDNTSAVDGVAASPAATQTARGPVVQYSIVNEAGASVYSTSELGAEELPNIPPHARSSVSIGRRLMDPLSELVKISPGNLGVGLYQHDIKAKHLGESLDEVVEQCVNYVGVNSNTASPALLAYVSGLNQLTARRLFEFRQTTPLTNRQQLKQIAGIGDATFVQAAGFLRIYGGDEPFDETSIHPESYWIAEKVLERVGWTKQEWHNRRNVARLATDAASKPTGIQEANAAGDNMPASSGRSDAVDTQSPNSESASMAGESPTSAVRTTSQESVSHDAVSRDAIGVESRDPFATLDPVALAAELGVGELLMRDIIDSLRRPGHDPRQNAKGPVFRSGIIKLEDLQPGMKLESQVVNVVDFGLFVDVGLGYSCLVHVSELSRGFVRDLYQLFAVGDRLTTWVKEVDIPRRRVKLTAVEPGTRGAGRSGRSGRGEGGRPPRSRDQRGARHDATRSDAARGDASRSDTARGDAARGGAPRGDFARRQDNRSGGSRDRRPGRDQLNVAGGPNAAAGTGNRSGAGDGRREGNNRFGGGRSSVAADGRGGQDAGNRSRFRGGDKRSRPRHEGASRPPAKPKPVKPITDEMLQGKKPMRSFSDLAQFFQKQKDDPKNP